MREESQKQAASRKANKVVLKILHLPEALNASFYSTTFQRDVKHEYNPA